MHNTPQSMYSTSQPITTLRRNNAQELADDIGAIDSNAKWPLNHIDWEAAAEELKMDYTEVNFNGTTYYIR